MISGSRSALISSVEEISISHTNLAVYREPGRLQSAGGSKKSTSKRACRSVVSGIVSLRLCSLRGSRRVIFDDRDYYGKNWKGGNPVEFNQQQYEEGKASIMCEIKGYADVPSDATIRLPGEYISLWGPVIFGFNTLIPSSTT